MQRRPIALLGAVAVAATSLVALLGQGAGAQPLTATADIVGITENQWLVSYDGFECPNDDPVVTEAIVTTTSGTEPIAIVSQSVASPGSVIVNLPPEGPAGTVTFTIECATVAPNPTDATDDYAILRVDKVVNGPAPEGTTFTVNVSCTGRGEVPIESAGFGDVGASQTDDPISPDLTYGATGGVAYVYSDFTRECVITETNNGGATSSTVDPESILIDAPEVFEATVTNVFPVVVEPTFTG